MSPLLLPLGLSTSLLEEDFTEIATDENHLVSFDTFGIYWISASFAVKQLRNKLMFFYNTFIAISFCNKLIPVNLVIKLT